MDECILLYQNTDFSLLTSKVEISAQIFTVLTFTPCRFTITY